MLSINQWSDLLTTHGYQCKQIYFRKPILALFPIIMTMCKNHPSSLNVKTNTKTAGRLRTGHSVNNIKVERFVQGFNTKIYLKNNSLQIPNGGIQIPNGGIQMPKSIGGVMVRVFASSAVDRGFELRSDQITNYKIGICCFSDRNPAFQQRKRSNRQTKQ